jgi:hypothetical protein
VFPFFIATAVDDWIPVVAPHEPEYVAAFTTLCSGRAFLERAAKTNWRFRFIAHDHFQEMVGNLWQHGVRGVCLDSSPGLILSFAELAELWSRL